MAFDPDKYLAEKAAPAAGGFDPDAYLSQKVAPKGDFISRAVGAVGGALQTAAGPAAWAGEKFDRFWPGGAPARAAAGAIQEDLQDGGSLPGAAWKGIKAFGRQYRPGAPEAPQTSDIYARAGLSDEIEEDDTNIDLPSFGSYHRIPYNTTPIASPADVAGFATDLLIPGPSVSREAAILGAMGKAGGGAAKVAAKTAAGAVDLATGTKAGEKTLDAVGAVAEGTGNLYNRSKEGLGKLFKAKQADDFGESVKTAMANGIDPKLLPEAVEFGPNSIVTRTARVQAEGIAGQPLLDKFNEGLEQVRGAVRRDVERLGMGAPVSKPEAGAILREGFNQGVDRAFAAVNTSHRGVIEAAPELRLSRESIGDLAPKLGELEKWATAKADNGLTNTAKEQGKQILRAVEKFRAKGESYAGAFEALQEIGEVAFKKTNSLADVPPDIARFRKLYGEISEAMIKTVDDAFGAGQGQALRDSNAAMTKIFGDKSLLGKIGDGNLSDEALFSSLIEQGDTKRIAALKEYLQPEQLAALKGAFLDGLIKTNPQGEFPFRSLHNALRQKGSVASILFEPGELDNMQGLIKLGDKFGSAVMSTSGTGGSNAIREGIRDAANMAADASVSEGVKKKARAIGFDIEEATGKAAAKKPGPGPIMGGLRTELPKFSPYGSQRNARIYSLYGQEEDDEE